MNTSLAHTQRFSIAKVLPHVCALFKVRLSLLILMTTFGGMWLTPLAFGLWDVFLVLGLVWMLVAGASALNMYLEKDVDALMERTKDRPLPSGQISETLVLKLGLVLSCVSILLIGLLINEITALLASLALFLYCALYTPLKRRSALALWVGAISGAMPPLLGWTSVTGQLDLQGLSLFSILFLWQIPHFLAITLYRQNEYEKAGLRVLSLSIGERLTKYQILQYSALLFPATLMLYPLKLAGKFYFAGALFLGMVFIIYACLGLQKKAGTLWARHFFFMTLFYMTGLCLFMIFDRVYSPLL